MKKQTMKPMIINAGGINLISIRLILRKATKTLIGPSKASVIVKYKLLSIIPKSFESLLTIKPEEVSSKKLEGLRTIESIIF